MTSQKSLGLLFTAFLIAILTSPLLIGQERTKALRIERIEVPPKIDGQIDEDVWTRIQPVSGFFQFDPVNGAPASEETFVWAT